MTTPYDLLLKGGILVDPAQKIQAVQDVALSKGRVTAVGEGLLSSDARRVLDCSGHIVAPGMIDLHVHVFWGVSHYGIQPDPNCIAKGVTTAVDAGSSGADTFSGFRKYVMDVSATRLFACLNISSQGMLTDGIGELENIHYANVTKAVAMAEKHRDVILGIKVRLSKKFLNQGAGIRPLYLAREAADALKLPIMVHPQDPLCNSLDDILAVMRDRDILTHCFHGKEAGILTSGGQVRKSVREAAERGVLFDVGHGVGSFKWETAERALSQDFQPHTISSDLHIYNTNGPVYDLATTVSKFLYLGLSLEEVFYKVTAMPAHALRMSDQIGTLKVGAWGDAVVFKIQEGKFELADAHGQIRIGNRRLWPTAVIRAGKIFSAERE